MAEGHSVKFKFAQPTSGMLSTNVAFHSYRFNFAPSWSLPRSKTFTYFQADPPPTFPKTTLYDACALSKLDQKRHFSLIRNNSRVMSGGISQMQLKRETRK